MNEAKKRKIEFGDFQTPISLAFSVCSKLKELGLNPKHVIEPTCGVGAFLFASAEIFTSAESFKGYEINEIYLDRLQHDLSSRDDIKNVTAKQADFFNTDWEAEISNLDGDLMVVGNFPWVTNSGIGAIGGTNLPVKSNFLKQNGFDSISGKANFDISEWMLLEVMNWFKSRNGSIAMLVKTAVARKILSHAENQGLHLSSSSIYRIDAKKEFDASVDACLLLMNFDKDATDRKYDYEVFDSLDSKVGHVVGNRNGFSISDLKLFNQYLYLFGSSPVKWRSGVKHDCSSVMELTRVNDKFENGLGQIVPLEDDYLYPLLKGSDVGSGKPWREKFVLVTQRRVGEDTSSIKTIAPNTWAYLNQHRDLLDARGSSIYKKNPSFSVFGVGDYAFCKWKIAICALYKNFEFRLISPIEGKCVMFDDTVYYISFDSKDEADLAYSKITSSEGLSFLRSMIFFDEKRPVKTGLLNVFDWTKVRLNLC